MVRPKKDAVVDFGNTHCLTVGLIERAVCPQGRRFVLLKDADKRGLRLRITEAGGRHWQFEVRVKGRLFTRSLGEWPAVSIKEAQEEAHRLRGMTERGVDPRVIEEVERQRIEQERTAQLAHELELRAKLDAEEQARAHAARYTLRSLLNDYCEYQQSIGRTSHKDARSIFKLHIFDPWPSIADMPATEISGEQIADMMRRLVELDKGRTANKLRSYIGAAYSTARAARSRATVPVSFKAYNVRLNPVAETLPDSGANRPARDPLSAEELRIYWLLIRDLPGTAGTTLRLHLLTGGQRIEQLVKLRTSDVKSDSILLFDGKGRPGQHPRPHLLPLTEEGREAIAALKPSGAYAISTDNGVTHVHATTLASWAKEIVGDSIVGFQMKRIRSGIETALASAGVSSDIRGRLQSHGISGVQARHYDGHDYMPEKTRALKTLLDLLEVRS